MPLRGILALFLIACGNDVSISKQRIDDDSDGYFQDADCDDKHASVNPDAPEICDGLDNDCDGDVDTDATDATTWFMDADGDGYGEENVSSCTQPDGTATKNGDCDDTNAAISPDVPEHCDGIDEDCDGTIDNAPIDASLWYTDADEDGYGDALIGPACSGSTGTSAEDGDCDDGNAAIHPNAPEVDCADPTDYNCDGSVGYADADADGTPACEDCNDTDASAHPGASEVCDGADDDCDGTVDNGVLLSYYRDGDSDGYGDAGQVTAACSAPSGYSSDATDCDDADATIYPGAAESCDGQDHDCDGLVLESSSADASLWYADSDGDLFGGGGGVYACTAPTGHVADGTDCLDSYASVYPGAPERCDGVDEDCNGSIDNNAVDATFWYADTDGDRFGNAGRAQSSCTPPAGYVADATDCDDTLNAVNPAATELCDSANTDEDCDGLADDADASAIGQSRWYTDADADGAGGAGITLACDQPAGTLASSTDCDDTDATIYPGAQERCDAADIDEDCNGLADDDDPAVLGTRSWYLDADADGYAGSTRLSACDSPAGYLTTSTDCNDGNAAINPAASEICDSADTDEDCDGLTDDSDASSTGKSTWYADNDRDGYGGTATTSACDQPAGYLASTTDCNDTLSAINPGATELCDAANTDENCDGLADDNDSSATGKTTWYRDVDGDGYGGSNTTSACDQPAAAYATSTDCNDSSSSINPGATEVCDTANTDEDCDGLADDLDSAATGKSTWYRDVDGDGYAGSTTTSACDQPAATYATSTDCNDSASSINPGATEVCDTSNVDEDCDGLADDADSSATGQTSWYTDGDGDGYAGTSSLFCDQPAGSSGSSTDCNDASASINPGATEICGDSIDQNCTGGDLACVQWSGTQSVGSSYTTRITGFNTAANLGTGMAGGDFDGDGVGDLLVGDPDYNYHTYWGTLFGYYGSLVQGSWQAALNDDFLYYDISSAYSGDYAGRIANIGDISSDGKDDFVVLGVSSTSLLYYGGDTGTATHSANLDRTVTCSHTSALGNWQTSSPAVEWLCGDESYNSSAGIAYVYSGTSSSLLGSYAGESSSDAAGSALGAGDFDGDGSDDIVVGAYQDDDGGSNAGAVYIVLSTNSSISSLSAADTKIRGAAASDLLGSYVKVLNDVNGDGYADLAVGAPYQDGAASNAGAVYLITEPTTGAVNTMAFATITGSAANQGLGQQGIERGDFDGNGLDDLAVSSIYYNSSAGATWLFYAPGSGSYSVTTADAFWPGISASDYFGYVVVAVPDTNGDGKDDLAISAPNGDSSVGANMGTVWFWLAP